MTKQRLKCRVLNGCFSDERTIVMRHLNGEELSMFVPASEVFGEIDHEGAVAVDVFEQEGTTWAVLPTEYRDSYAVNAEDVVPS